MKILHYTLGFQPSRTGGLVKYAEDLMNQQVESGYKVAEERSIEKIGNQLKNIYQQILKNEL